MKAEYINSFYKATQDVLKTMLDIEVEKGKLDVVEGMINSKDANVSLGVTGDLKGSILFRFTKAMTLEMVKIMAGIEMDEIDVFVSSALGEVANIIGGNALTNLTAYEYVCDIAPPQVIVGDYKSLSFANEKALLVTMNTDIGEFDIIIYLTEN